MDYKNYLNELENKSIYIIREAYFKFRNNLAALWSCGKDSTTLVYLIRKAFLDQVFIPVIHIDTTFKFSEIYEFRDKYAKKWHLNLIIASNQEAIKNGVSPDKDRFNCCHQLKTEALKKIIWEYKFKALLLGIRRDEHAIRAKERYFSPRDKKFIWNYLRQPLEVWDQFSSLDKESGHLRIHPLLHWREIDIWNYIKLEKIPVVDLYFSKKGLRYRSIGCKCCCQPISSKANTIDKIVLELKSIKVSERAGRIQDKEKEFMMQKLRSLGYM